VTYKKKLIQFVKIKNLIITTISYVTYADEGDIDDIKSWSEKVCKEIYEFMIEYFNHNSDDYFGYSIYIVTCPWCIYYRHIKHNKDCNRCSYGKRNGICNSSGSIYKRLLCAEAFSSLTKDKYKKIMDVIEK